MTGTFSAKEVTATYGELALVVLPAINCSAPLGWEMANLYNETFVPDDTEGRKSAAEATFVPRLRKGLERINQG